VIATETATAPSQLLHRHPIPGGRLNIVQDDTFTSLDATTNTIVNTGRCPHGPASPAGPLVQEEQTDLGRVR
jgi:hypothetical protein